jgi:hypothetical protein
MALASFCAAGFVLGVFFDLFALVFVMMVAVPCAFLVCADSGMVSALLTASGLMIALQLGFAVGLATLRLGSALRVVRPNGPTKRPKR